MGESPMRNILIIDDEKDFCSLVKGNLETVGNYKVSICCDSTKAIKQTEELHPDLILLDIAMPKKSGLDVAAEFKNNKNTRNIPVIFLSAIISEEEIAKRKNLISGSHFVAKPVKTDELINIIDKVIKDTDIVIPQAKNKIRTVTFLTRQQIDFLDNLGKDVLFYQGYKLSRTEILSELVDFLMELKVDAKKIGLAKESLAKGIFKILNSYDKEK